MWMDTGFHFYGNYGLSGNASEYWHKGITLIHWRSIASPREKKLEQKSEGILTIVQRPGSEKSILDLYPHN